MIGELLQTAALTLPYWRSPAVALLVLFILGCLTFTASAWGEE